MVVDLVHPVFGHIRETGSPIKIDGAPPVYWPAAPLGADTEAVLRAAGLDAAEIAGLRRDGVI
jgi:crotonobetainyl-CoA:carnitine CoA-transferase CaiB-like acyl-CoA transferase